MPFRSRSGMFCRRNKWQKLSLSPTIRKHRNLSHIECGRRPLRSSTDRTLTVPQTHNRFGDRSFAVAGPHLWNSLSISLSQISSFGQFKRYLKNHLFGIWEITAQCDAWFSALYKYSYLLTYLLTYLHLPIVNIIQYWQCAVKAVIRYTALPVSFLAECYYLKHLYTSNTATAHSILQNRPKDCKKI